MTEQDEPELYLFGTMENLNEVAGVTRTTHALSRTRTLSKLLEQPDAFSLSGQFAAVHNDSTRSCSVTRGDAHAGCLTFRRNSFDKGDFFLKQRPTYFIRLQFQ